jgi:putative ABC transport system ATP-binding protein
MNILEVKNLCKTYLVNKRQNNVLRNVNFIVSEGEMTAVMGPSGSGKSTLLYTVSGMDGITSGEVLFCGKNITAMGEKELADVRLDEMGFIFQQMYMLKNLTVLDNIILPAVQSKKNGASRRQTNERGRALMRRLGIDEVGGSDINEVSGGQLQRACICRSMINNPRMIFADEPTGALNRASSDEVMNELLSLNRDGTTIMCVTHDSKVAARCSRVLYIVDGGIVGEKEMGHFGGGDNEFRDRERELNNWLMEQGW